MPTRFASGSRESRRRRESRRTPARSWSVQIIVEFRRRLGGCRNANGPIGVTVLLAVTVRAANGPIALDDVDGQVIARASMADQRSGSRGDIEAVTMNGPISVVPKGGRREGSSTRGRRAAGARHRAAGIPLRLYISSRGDRHGTAGRRLSRRRRVGRQSRVLASVRTPSSSGFQTITSLS